MELYDAITRTTIVIDKLLRDDVLVVHYDRPTRLPGGLIELLPAEDTTNTLWEVVQSNPKAEEALGIALSKGDIIVTLRRWPRDTGHETINGQRVFVMGIEAAGVRGVYPVAAYKAE